jgi:hypothetical protein
MTTELLIGPVEGRWPSHEDLALAWDLRAADVMRAAPDGTRPWACWEFDIGEPKPSNRHAEAVRLAELRLLAPDELAALAEQANEAQLRVGTPHEQISGGNRETGISMDAQAVELWEAVDAAMKRSSRRIAQRGGCTPT